MTVELQFKLKLGKSQTNVFHIPETEQMPGIKVSAKDGERNDMIDVGLLRTTEGGQIRLTKPRE